MLTKEQASIEICLMLGRHFNDDEAPKFLNNLLKHYGGNVTAIKKRKLKAEPEAPIHELTAQELEAADKAVIAAYYEEPIPAKDLYEKACQLIIESATGRYSGVLKKELKATDNQWHYLLRKLHNDSRFTYSGYRQNMKWLVRK